MKKFSCGAVVEGCDAVVEGSTEEEVLQAAAAHAGHAHGLTDLSPDVVAAVRAQITDG